MSVNISYLLEKIKSPFISNKCKPVELDCGMNNLKEYKADDVGKLNIPMDEVTCFIPSSGAATRFFSKLLLAKNTMDFSDKEIIVFFENFVSFPFGKKILAILDLKFKEFSGNEKKQIIETLFFHKDFSFNYLPKALTVCHKYSSKEKLTFADENVSFFQKLYPNIKLHFTIDYNYLKEFTLWKNKNDFDENVTFSFQDKNLQSIVLDNNYNLILNKDGSPILRPGGHGALFDNLQNIDSKYIILKNVDNISRRENQNPDYYLKMLCQLESIKNYVFSILNKIKNKEEINKSEVIQYIEKNLGYIFSNKENVTTKQLKNILDRPLRVCGAVYDKNFMGGGVYWFEEKNKDYTLQIMEGLEIDEKTTPSKFFNPVHLVLYTHDFEGNKFDLNDFRNTNRFLKIKKITKNGEINSLEYPGLWNGSMHNWNSHFVILDKKTFTPVKNINDLINPDHIYKSK